MCSLVVHCSKTTYLRNKPRKSIKPSTASSAHFQKVCSVVCFETALLRLAHRSRARLALFSNTTSLRLKERANLSATLPHTTAIRDTILPAPRRLPVCFVLCYQHLDKAANKALQTRQTQLSAPSRDPCAAAACRRTGSTSHSRILSSAHPSTMPGVRKSHPQAHSLTAFVALANHSLQ